MEFTDRLIKQIEIYKQSTEQIKNDNPKILDVNELSIEHEETSENIISKEYIMNINKVNVLYNLVMTKKLNIKNGGPIKVSDISLKNLDKYKKIIIDTLYPS